MTKDEILQVIKQTQEDFQKITESVGVKLGSDDAKRSEALGHWLINMLTKDMPKHKGEDGREYIAYDNARILFLGLTAAASSASLVLRFSQDQTAMDAAISEIKENGLK